MGQQQPHREVRVSDEKRTSANNDQSLSSPCEALRAEERGGELFSQALQNKQADPRNISFEGGCISRLKRRDARFESENLVKS